MSLSLLLRLLWTSIRSSISTRAAFLFRAAMMAMNNVVFFSIWLILYAQAPAIGGYGLDDMLLLFGFAAAAFGLGYSLCAGFTRLPELVRSGSLDLMLSKPQSPLAFVLTSRSEPSAWGDLVTGIVMIVLSGKIDLAGWVALPMLLSISAVVIAASGLAFFSLAFWLSKSEDASNRLFETLIMFSLYPEGIFPWGLRALFYTVIPSAFVVFVPIRALDSLSVGSVALAVGAAAGWVLVAATIFHAGVRRYIQRPE